MIRPATVLLASLLGAGLTAKPAMAAPGESPLPPELTEVSTSVLQDAERAEESPKATVKHKKEKRFSIGVSFGVTPDMGTLGTTMLSSGAIDVNATSMAATVYSTTALLMSDNNNMTIYHNSQHTDSPFRLMGEAPTQGGALLGAELGITAQYELDDVLGVPLYFRTGFMRTSSVVGGSQKRMLGDAVTRSSDLVTLLEANGEDPTQFINGVMETNWSAAWSEIPITFGLKIPLKPRSFVYGGFGVSFFQGGLDIGIDIDERYANVLATHVDLDTLSLNNQSPGAVQDNLKFQLGGLGVNWSLGAQTQLGKKTPLVLFMELNSSTAAKIVYSGPLKPETRALLTSISSQDLAAADSEWFKRISLPVVAGGGSFRLGLRYYLF